MAAPHGPDPGEDARRILHTHLGWSDDEAESEPEPTPEERMDWDRWANDPMYWLYCQKRGYPPPD